MRYPNPIQSQMQAFSVSSMTRGITGKFFPVIAPTIEPQKPKPRAEAVIPRRRLRRFGRHWQYELPAIGHLWFQFGIHVERNSETLRASSPSCHTLALRDAHVMSCDRGHSNRYTAYP